MNRILKISIFVIAASFIFSSCDDWTQVEPYFEPETIGFGDGKDEAYYENLRAFKATMLDRKLSFAWFGYWNATGSYLSNSLSGLPDSMDVISIWGDTWKDLDKGGRREDLEYVQKVKGTKVLVCDLIGSIGSGYTPAGVSFQEHWGWEGDLNLPTVTERRTTVPTPNQEAIIRKYARLYAEDIIARGFDGYDMDFEIGYGSAGTLVEYYERLRVYLDEMSKYFGPKSGTGRLMIMDGAVNNLPSFVARYFDFFVIQAYNSGGDSDLNLAGVTANRFGAAVNTLRSEYATIDSIAERVVMAENWEGGRHATGGRVGYTSALGGSVPSLKGMALWIPTHSGISYRRSGGCGVFHVEYEYGVPATNGYTGFYPWMREAIQIMNPAQH